MVAVSESLLIAKHEFDCRDDKTGARTARVRACIHYSRTSEEPSSPLIACTASARLGDLRSFTAQTTSPNAIDPLAEVGQTVPFQLSVYKHSISQDI